MTDDVLVVEVADRVATVTLNRPAARNALSRALRRALYDGIGALNADATVDAVVITGADPAFCAGLDLKELGSATEPAGDDVGVGLPGDGRPAHEHSPIPPISKPIIGAINGPAITGGFELALRCDLLVASENGCFADTHARMGIMPGWGLTVLLAEAVGRRRAREMSLTGNFVDAATALTWGLVNHVVPHAELVPFTQQLAADMVSNDQAGVQRMLRTYAEQSLVSGAEAFEIEATVSRRWQGDGFDPAEIERRRTQVTARGHAQV
jgi:enoyl-CoA hydratase